MLLQKRREEVYIELVSHKMQFHKFYLFVISIPSTFEMICLTCKHLGNKMIHVYNNRDHNIILTNACL